VPIRRLDRTRTLLLSVAAGWGATLVIGALVVPAYSSSRSATVAISGSPPTTAIVTPPRTSTARTLVDVNGLRVLAIVAIPLLAVGLVTMALRTRRVKMAWSVTAVVIALTLVGILTIGVFVLPVAVLLGVACGRASRGTRPRSATAWSPARPV
jgi:hypothetical protein